MRLVEIWQCITMHASRNAWIDKYLVCSCVFEWQTTDDGWATGKVVSEQQKKNTYIRIEILVAYEIIPIDRKLSKL